MPRLANLNARIVRPMGPLGSLDLSAAEIQKRRDYNADYYRRVRAPKLKKQRRQRSVGEVLDWLEAETERQYSPWLKDLFARARKKFSQGRA